MSDIPRKAFTRTARLAALPVGLAGRATIGLGRRIGGQSAELVSAQVQAKTAEHVFRVLGELKGGAMKVGQAMSVFEAALPEELAGPYRAALTRLQEAAPPMPTAVVHKVLADGLGPDWRSRFAAFDDSPTAAASIGQVHRATWTDGRPVAVKVQYPGAGPALLADLQQVGRLARMLGVLTPGLDVAPLVAELKERVTEELDYAREAQATSAFAAAFRDDPDFAVPEVLAGSSRVLVTEWVGGVPLSRVIAEGTPEQRDRAGLLLVRFHLSAPSRAGLLHADPHPGNFRLLPDGRLGVLDFGAVNHLPDGFPTPIGELARLAISGDADAVLGGLRAEGFVKPGLAIDPAPLLDYLSPMLDPVRADEFAFSREWLRAQATRMSDPRSPAWQLGRKLNLPPDYLLIHRTTLGAVGVLCQLGARGPFRAEMQRWMPGFDG